MKHKVHEGQFEGFQEADKEVYTSMIYIYMCVCVRMNICSRYFFHKNKTLNYSGIQVFLSILSCLSIWQRKISHRFWLRLDIGEFQHGKVQRLGCLVGSWAAGMQMYMPVCLPEKTS